MTINWIKYEWFFDKISWIFIENTWEYNLDENEPDKVKYRTQPYLLGPAETYEQVGDVPNVVFPCAALHDIKEDKFTKVTCEYFETRQFKTSTIVASAEFKDNKTKQLLDRFPVESTFLFEHFFATYQGDKRAIEDVYLDYISNRRVIFPNTEQMIFDTGEDLKLRLKDIITGYNFRG